MKKPILTAKQESLKKSLQQDKKESYKRHFDFNFKILNMAYILDYLVKIML